MLEKARIKIYPETYVSLMLLVATLTIPVSVMSIAIFILVRLHAHHLPNSHSILRYGRFSGSSMSKASDRATGLEREMPFAAAYISVMASGGIAPYTSFKRLSDVELMPAMRGEAREIIKDVEIFGIDPLTALESCSQEEPVGHIQRLSLRLRIHRDYWRRHRTFS